MDLTQLLRDPGPDTWETFVRAWRDDLAGYSDDELDGVPMPQQLCRYYEVAGRVPTFNLHLSEPRELVVEDDLVAFLTEEQGVYSFATRVDGVDPPVFTEEDAPWVLCGERLGRFLLQHALFEATFTCGVYSGWGWVDPPDLAAVIDVLPQLPLAPWRVPLDRPTTFHAADALIGIVFPSADLAEVHASAWTPEAFEPLLPLVAWQWRHEDGLDLWPAGTTPSMEADSHPREDDRNEEVDDSPAPDPEDTVPGEIDDPQAD
jgi:hypothetical protein